jgi:hypothetical protein
MSPPRDQNLNSKSVSEARYPVGCRLLKKSQMTALALGSPGTGSKLDPNHV